MVIFTIKYTQKKLKTKQKPPATQGVGRKLGHRTVLESDTHSYKTHCLFSVWSLMADMTNLEFCHKSMTLNKDPLTWNVWSVHSRQPVNPGCRDRVWQCGRWTHSSWRVSLEDHTPPHSPKSHIWNKAGLWEVCLIVNHQYWEVPTISPQPFLQCLYFLPLFFSLLSSHVYSFMLDLQLPKTPKSSWHGNHPQLNDIVA